MIVNNIFKIWQILSKYILKKNAKECERHIQTIQINQMNIQVM